MKRREHERSVKSTPQLTPWMEENMEGSCEPRKFVHDQHNEDCDKAKSFIESKWETTEFQPSDSEICWAVSTTKLSTMLLLSRYIESAFTRNTYSPIEQEPWLITQSVMRNKPLSVHISKVWSKKDTHLGNRDLVNQIAEHVVYKYDRERKEWLLLPITATKSNVIRFMTDDFVMWSHPPRDQPLRRVLETEDPEGTSSKFKQVEGNLVKDLEDFIVHWRINTRISFHDIQAAEDKKLKKISKKFSDVYEFYEKAQSRLPNSYKWPTLQMEVKSDGGKSQHYGEASAGVYNRNDNRVHQIFPALNVKARALPSKKVVFNELLAKSIGLTPSDG